MAALTRVGKPSLATTLADPGAHQIKGRVASGGLSAGDMVYLTAVSGVPTLAKANGTALDALALDVGMVLDDLPAGEKAVAYHGVEVRYASGMTAGTRYFVSNAAAGGLDTTASTGGSVARAFATNDTNLYILSPTR